MGGVAKDLESLVYKTRVIEGFIVGCEEYEEFRGEGYKFGIAVLVVKIYLDSLYPLVVFVPD